jgi:hypothetical protein
MDLKNIYILEMLSENALSLLYCWLVLVRSRMYGTDIYSVQLNVEHATTMPPQ